MDKEKKVNEEVADNEVIIDVDAKEVVEEDKELDINLQPELTNKESRKQLRKFKSIARKVKNKIRKEERKAKKIAKQETEANGQTTKKDVAVAYAWVIVQGAIVLGGLILGATTALPLVAFATGIVTSFSGIALVANVRDAIKKYKEYKEVNPTKKKEKKAKKEKKEKGKKLGLGKKIKKIFSKLKNKSDDGNESLKNPPVPEIQPEYIVPLPESELVSEAQPVNPCDDMVPVNYSLDQNGPKVKTVDLSNINIKPGLNIESYHFIVKKDDEVMQELVEQYIERMTNSPAMYDDKVIEGEEKRVYMLNK